MNQSFEGKKSEQDKKNIFTVLKAENTTKQTSDGLSKPLGMWEPPGDNSDSEDERDV